MEKILVIVLGFLLFGCSNNHSKENITNTHQGIISNEIKVDESQIAIFPFDSTNNWTFEKGKTSQLTREELIKIEEIIIKCISAYNPDQIQQFEKLDSINPNSNLDIDNFKIQLERYKRQYIPIINEQEEKIVLINCFCNTFNMDWKKEIILVKDGGNCYFQLKINLDKNEYYDFWVNGNA